MSRLTIVALWIAMTAAAWGQTFGRVVALGGNSADLALDEPRRALYVANFTANRVDVVNIDTGTLSRSMNVSSQPSSLALSPDGKYLVVAHYSNFTTPNTPRNALSVIDLSSGGRQTFALTDPPYGVAFGLDGRALVVTSTQFILFDPAFGTMQVIDTVAGVSAKTLPQPPASYPTQIVGASVAASGDGRRIYGVTDKILYGYDVLSQTVSLVYYTAEPPLGPRAVSIAKDGSYYLAGWGLFDARGLWASFPNPAGILNIGSSAIDSDRGLVYAQTREQVPQTTTTGNTGGTTQQPGTTEAVPQIPFLQVMDADNLNVRQKLLLPENLSGKGLLSSDGTVMYALSESGVMILPVGGLNQYPRVQATKEDVVFTSTFCDQRILTQELTIVDPSGAKTDFSVSTKLAGVRFSQSSGYTPATIKVTLDPSAFSNVRGTIQSTIDIRSSQAVNIVPTVRLLVNIEDPDQRGTVISVPGKLVDILADPFRNRFFVLRQDTNQVLVFDGSNFQQVATLRTGSTPTSLALTFDRRYLLVGNDNSQIANVFDLETLETSAPIRFPGGHYPRYLAASGRAILASTRVFGPKHKIDRVDFYSRTATELSTLGVFENDINLNTALVANPNGSSILIAQADGGVMLYDSNADTFTISRKDTTSLSGAVAASNFGQFVIGNVMYNSSVVPVRRFDGSVGTPSGFVFLDQTGLRNGAVSAQTPGFIQRVDLNTGTGARTTRLAEAPYLGETGSVFTRSMAVMQDRSAIVNLTTSGFTVVPWTYDAVAAVPKLESVVNAADQTKGVAPGGLIIIKGRDLSPVNVATKEIPLPTALGESCLTVNGLPVPMIFVSSTQINAQLPFQAEGNVTMVLRTPGGVSDNYNLSILPSAPSIFRNQDIEAPIIVRSANGEIATASNPVRGGDTLVIYTTGLGKTTPEIPAGRPAPADPLSIPLVEIKVTLAGVELPIAFAGLTPGQIGVYQINVAVPHWVPKGMSQDLTITQGGYTTTATVRVVD
jgi:uncharacterized protein (TIGR03437 family)